MDGSSTGNKVFKDCNQGGIQNRFLVLDITPNALQQFYWVPVEISSYYTGNYFNVLFKAYTPSEQTKVANQEMPDAGITKYSHASLMSLKCDPSNNLFYTFSSGVNSQTYIQYSLKCNGKYSSCGYSASSPIGKNYGHVLMSSFTNSLDDVPVNVGKVSFILRREDH